MKVYIFFVLLCAYKCHEHFEIANCDKTINCYKLGACASFSACNGIAMYYFNLTDNMFYVTLATSKKWVAFGQNVNGTTNKMAGLRGAYCTDIPKIGFLSAVQQGPPTWHATIDVVGVTDATVTSANGVLKCSFKRQLKITNVPSQAILYDWDQTNLFHVMAFGASLNGDDPAYHLTTGHSVDSVIVADFKSKTLPLPTTPAGTTTPTPTSANQHLSSAAMIITMLLIAVFVRW